MVQYISCNWLLLMRSLQTPGNTKKRSETAYLVAQHYIT